MNLETRLESWWLSIRKLFGYRPAAKPAPQPTVPVDVPPVVPEDVDPGTVAPPVVEPPVQPALEVQIIVNPTVSGSVADKTNFKPYTPPYHNRQRFSVKWSTACGDDAAECWVAGKRLECYQIDTGEAGSGARRLCFTDKTRPVYTLPRPAWATLVRGGRTVAAFKLADEDYKEPTTGTSQSRWFDLPRTCVVPL